MCVVEAVTHYKPVPLNVFKARDFSDDAAETQNSNNKKRDVKEPKSQACICVRLRPLAAAKKKEKEKGVGDSSTSSVYSSPLLDGSFQASVYLESELPEFVVKKAVFEQSCKLKNGARVKMWFANNADAQVAEGLIH